MYTFTDLEQHLPYSRNTLKRMQKEGFFVPPSEKNGRADYFTPLQLEFMKATLGGDLKKRMNKGIEGCRVVAIHNTKGGVAKTATTINLAYHLAKQGHEVCLIDADPQGTSSVILGARQLSIGKSLTEEGPNLFHLLFQNAELADCSRKVGWQTRNGQAVTFDLIPSGRSMRTVDTELFPLNRRYERLKFSVTDHLRNHYDYVLIDTPQFFTLIGLNSLFASDYVLIPTTATPESFDVFTDIFASLLEVQDSSANGLNHPLLVAGILITNFDARTNTSQEFKDLILQTFGKRVFDTLIPSRVAQPEANSSGMPVEVFDPESDLAKSYAALTEEFLVRMEGNFEAS